jgi:hypothetical protein
MKPHLAIIHAKLVMCSESSTWPSKFKRLRTKRARYPIKAARTNVGQTCLNS